MPRSSSCLRISCSAGTFFSSGSHTTTAASQAVSAWRRVGLELDRAGAIEEGEAIAEEIDGGDVELDAHAVMAGLLRGVAHRIAAGRRALAGDGAGARQNGFEKRGLSAEIGANQCDAAGAAGWLALRLAHDLLP